MPKYWQTKGFKNLEAIWELKLAESGFNDAETTIKNNRVLKQNSSNCYRQAPQVVRENKERYFSMLTHCMEYMPPKDRVDRLVMHYLSLGSKIREICEMIRSVGGPNHRQTIRFIIRRYEQAWGIRSWAPEKLDANWKTNRTK
jgi:hypothetical protein